eukprot:TRINITY_DN11829_c0_g1_i1.p1 TRINITY_DN11829_c0_g1~~TRINITY_DN11829_c0_g1_i1.p1  ORF type:complete len:125 (+),score=16.16 TRINITY_DN11829_c0_g1_i1:393-767(+)
MRDSQPLVHNRPRQPNRQRSKQEIKVEWNLRRKPYVEALKAELDELDAIKTPAWQLLDYVYEKHPPKRAEHKRPSEDKSMKWQLRKAMTHYHMDKQNEVHYGTKWKVLAEEIYKRLAVHYEACK